MEVSRKTTTICRAVSAVTLIVTVLAGCITSGPPAWVGRFPGDSRYYIGIGSSNTGNSAEDRQVARERALSNLAGSISTHIISTQTVQAVEDSSGEAYQRAEQQILETINQSVREVEIVDSYYSETDGFWIYMRLSKAVWERLQKREIAATRERVESLVNDPLSDGNLPTLGQMHALFSALSVISASPFLGSINGRIDKREGVLIDLIESEIVRRVEGLSIAFEPPEMACEYGQNPDTTVRVIAGDRRDPGNVPVVITLQDGQSTELARWVTQADGTYAGSLLLPSLGVGSYEVTAAIDIGQLGADVNVLRVPIVAQSATCVLSVRPIRVSLTAYTIGAEVSGGIRQGFADLFSGDLPVTIDLAAADSRYRIDIQVHLRNAPPNDYGIIVAHARAQVTVIEGATAVFSFESAEFKDGGLTEDQAHTRAVAKLMEGLEADRAFLSDFKKAFLLD